MTEKKEKLYAKRLAISPEEAAARLSVVMSGLQLPVVRITAYKIPLTSGQSTHRWVIDYVGGRINVPTTFDLRHHSTMQALMLDQCAIARDISEESWGPIFCAMAILGLSVIIDENGEATETDAIEAVIAQAQAEFDAANPETRDAGGDPAITATEEEAALAKEEIDIFKKSLELARQQDEGEGAAVESAKTAVPKPSPIIVSGK